jgi:hypothetical protein
MEHKLSLTLDLPFNQNFQVISDIPEHIYQLLFKAIHHQNTVEWDALYVDTHLYIGIKFIRYHILTIFLRSNYNGTDS